MSNEYQYQSRSQFTILTGIFALLFLFVVFGWFVNAMHAKKENQRLTDRVHYAETELDLLHSRTSILEISGDEKDVTPKGVLAHADLERANLHGAVIDGGDSAFQKTNFRHADMEQATISGGTASFQGANFDNAKLAGAQLSGRSASFQLSSFVNADLSGALLSGKGGSFQSMTFQGATLIDAKIVARDGAFQAVNIDGCKFQGADLSSIEPYALKTCHFSKPPTYNDATQFPRDFDPAREGWERVE